jgi:peroxiredoxin
MLPGGEPEEDETFSVHRPPSKRRLWEAGTCFVRDEDGNQVCFGDLFPRWPDATTPPTGAAAGDNREKMETALTALSRPPPKTVVFFIRTFWCGQCQDYTFASLGLLDREAIEKQNIRVVVISNGSWKIIKAYRKLFNCPFPIYVDASLKLYHLLGMKSSRDFGHWYKGRAAYHQRSVPSQIVTGIKNGLVNMPLANFGNVAQLGGEFILEPGYVCSWVSRMTTRSNHVEAPEVLRIAGVAHPTSTEVQEIKFAEDQRVELERLQAEMKEWRQNRETELERIRRRKAARRGEAYIPAPKRLSAVMGLDEELGELDPEMESGYIMGPNGEFIPLDTSERGSVRGSVRLAAMIEEDGEGEEEEEEDGGEEEDEGEEEEAAAQADKDELDRRFAEVMRIEEEKMKQRYAAAGELVMAEGHGVQVTQ